MRKWKGLWRYCAERILIRRRQCQLPQLFTCKCLNKSGSCMDAFTPCNRNLYIPAWEEAYTGCCRADALTIILSQGISCEVIRYNLWWNLSSCRICLLINEVDKCGKCICWARPNFCDDWLATDAAIGRLGLHSQLLRWANWCFNASAGLFLLTSCIKIDLISGYGLWCDCKNWGFN